MINLKLVVWGADNPALGSNEFLNSALDLAGISPKILIVPSASPTMTDIEETTYWLSRDSPAKGLPIQFLHGFEGAPSAERTKEMLSECNLLWFPGGNTRTAVQKLAPVAGIITSAMLEGRIVVAGASCGLNIWFDQAHTDAEMYEKEDGEA